MASDGTAELAAALGAPPPAGLEELSDDDLRVLAGLVARARRRQAAALEAAADDAFDHIPRLLRGAVRRAVGA